jgi:ATP-dependent DNA ligase
MPARPGSEGAYLKRADFPYELDGKTQFNLKYKNTFSIDAKVVAVSQVKKADAWNYLCVIGGENCVRACPSAARITPR